MPPPDDRQRDGVEAASAKHQGEAGAASVRRELAWVCQQCERSCWPIRSESRCLCGHRLKEHQAPGRACCNARCSCKAFYFIVSEGAWSLRCRCKHKAAEHDASTKACAKCKGGACAAFSSPWVCNCDHPWADHKQVEVERQVVSMAERMGCAHGELAEAAQVAQAAAVAAAAAEEIEAFGVVRRGLLN